MLFILIYLHMCYLSSFQESKVFLCFSLPAVSSIFRITQHINILEWMNQSISAFLFQGSSIYYLIWQSVLHLIILTYKYIHLISNYSRVGKQYLKRADARIPLKEVFWKTMFYKLIEMKSVTTSARVGRRQTTKGTTLLCIWNLEQ